MEKAGLSDSNRRVEEAARASGLSISIELSPAATRTAEEAATVRGCDVAQIVKSLIFRGVVSGDAILLLVSGANRVNEQAVAGVIGEAVSRPDAQFVRDVTGYAIGGIPPFGHRAKIKALMDADLLKFDTVYAAAGTPNSTFGINPHELQRVSEASVASVR